MPLFTFHDRKLGSTSILEISTTTGRKCISLSHTNPRLLLELANEWHVPLATSGMEAWLHTPENALCVFQNTKRDGGYYTASLHIDDVPGFIDTLSETGHISTEDALKAKGFAAALLKTEATAAAAEVAHLPAPISPAVKETLVPERKAFSLKDAASRIGCKESKLAALVDYAGNLDTTFPEIKGAHIALSQQEILYLKTTVAPMAGIKIQQSGAAR